MDTSSSSPDPFHGLSPQSLMAAAAMPTDGGADIPWIVAALGELCEAYYAPVVAYLRRSGRDEDAGCFAKVAQLRRNCPESSPVAPQLANQKAVQKNSLVA